MASAFVAATTGASQIDEWMFWESNNHEFFVAGCISHDLHGKVERYCDPMREERATGRWISWNDICEITNGSSGITLAVCSARLYAPSTLRGFRHVPPTEAETVGKPV
jgi:hypothetical protein